MLASSQEEGVEMELTGESVAVITGIKISVYVKVSDGSQLTYEATFQYKDAEKNVVKYLNRTLARFGKDSK